jgi:Holliday junction resolvase RusA-like endonuclease
VSAFSFLVLGKPIGKGRPRFAKGRVFTPHETTVAEEAVRSGWRESGQVRLPDGPVWLDVELGVTRPRGHFTTRGELSAEGQRNAFPHRQKPDVDNALKLICDALNTLAYADDVQIVTVNVRRRWSEAPFTRVAMGVLS